MSQTAEEYAGLAKDAYEDRREWIGRPDKGVSINGHLYKVIDAQDSPSGFQATAYQRVDTGEAIIAYRGTHGRQDALVDTVMVADKVNPQEADARAFTLRVLKYAREHGIPLDQVTVTGHSLGGTLAEIEVARFGLRGATFNAYGAVDLGYGVPEGGNRVTDYVVATDVVSAASRHYGQVVPLATVQDIAVLRASGYMDGHGKVLEVAQARALAAHSIDNFAPDTGGASVLNPGAAALAKANVKPIAAYDRDVHDTRGTLRLVSRLPGTPVWALARNAEFAGTLMTAGNALQDGIRRVEAALPGFNDPAHPQHAVHAALKARMPTGTSEDRLAQCTAACHAARLDRPEDLGEVYVTRTKALFVNNSLFGHLAEVDLTRPAPPAQDSLRRTGQFDCHQENQPARFTRPTRGAIHLP